MRSTAGRSSSCNGRTVPVNLESWPAITLPRVQDENGRNNGDIDNGSDHPPASEDRTDDAGDVGQPCGARSLEWKRGAPTADPRRLRIHLRDRAGDRGRHLGERADL